MKYVKICKIRVSLFCQESFKTNLALVRVTKSYLIIYIYLHIPEPYVLVTCIRTTTIVVIVATKKSKSSGNVTRHKNPYTVHNLTQQAEMSYTHLFCICVENTHIVNTKADKSETQSIIITRTEKKLIRPHPYNSQYILMQ